MSYLDNFVHGKTFDKQFLNKSWSYFNEIEVTGNKTERSKVKFL